MSKDLRESEQDYQTKPELSLIIPYYNEKNRLQQGTDILFKFLEKNELPFSMQILYMDDGSSDGTESLLKERVSSFFNSNPMLQEKIQFAFHRHSPNQGKGAAIKSAINKSVGRKILYTDFDLSISLQEIVPFWKSLSEQKKGQGLIIASRLQDSSVLNNQSFLRKWMGRVFNTLMKLIINLKVKDTQCGFKMIDRETALKIFPHLIIRGFAFDVELIKRASILNIPIIERGVEISFNDKHSTVNVYLDPLKMLWELLKFRVLFFRYK